MSLTHPSLGSVVKKMGLTASADNTAIAKTITVPSDQYGVLYKLWFNLDVASETDLENLPALLLVQVTIGSVVWSATLHPLIAHDDTTKFRDVDIGPWDWDFGHEGMYSSVKGDDILFDVLAVGTGIKADIRYQYSGD